jgi:CHRD domain
MRKITVAGLALAALALAFTGASVAGGGDGKKSKRNAPTALTGYQETPAVSTGARGQLRLALEDSRISYRLSYQGLEGGGTPVAHLHFGQTGVAGGIIAFLCGGGGKPSCPASGAVEGTIAAADVIGPTAQGIAAGQFNEVVRALRAGLVYANVHTAAFANGEIRGQVRPGGRDKSDDD